MNESPTKKPYTPPLLEAHLYSLIIGLSGPLPIVPPLGLEPMNNFMEEL